ncbi:MAG: nuclease A inhibitor family protein [Nostoc sp.]|uniref:nuclease A inhibitor family protein n=1 Tax=Nostoc sp. TaxID=1180 RepID=UPI002FFA9DB5
MAHTTSDSIIKMLKQAASGVFYTSESDYPFEVVHWKIGEPITTETIRQKTGTREDAPVEVIDLGEFFNPEIPDPDWYGAEEKAEAARYRNLMEILKNHLTNINVYRLGEIEIDIYILGQSKCGDIIGLATKSIET